MERFWQKRFRAKTQTDAIRGRNPSRPQGAAQKKRLDLFKFVPFRLNRLAAEVGSALSVEYQARYGLDIPEWRVLATLGFRNDACSAQYISHCTRTHKSTISRAVTALMERGRSSSASRTPTTAANSACA